MTDTHQAPGLVKMGDRDDWRIDFARHGGPWIVECGWTAANPCLGDTIAKVMVSYDADLRVRDFKTMQRRCYVIAAAPTMLAALHEWKCPGCGGKGTYQQNAVGRAREEARGRVPDPTFNPDPVNCKVCNGHGLHPTAQAAIAKATVPA